MANIEDTLMARLYRADCPEPAELGDYHLGLLMPQQAAVIHSHLAGCPHCTRELAQLEGYLAQVAADLDYSLADRVKIWVARLLPAAPAGGEAGLLPAMALRGDTQDGPRLYEAGEAQLSLEVQPHPEAAGRYTLLGLLLGAEPAGLTAQLWQEERPVAAAEVDEIGNFTLGPLEPGDYELILSGPSLEIHVQDLSIPFS